MIFCVKLYTSSEYDENMHLLVRLIIKISFSLSSFNMLIFYCKCMKNINSLFYIITDRYKKLIMKQDHF